MKKFSFVVLITLLSGGCASLFYLANLSDDADSAYQEGRYEEALELYDQLIDAHDDRGKEVEGYVYNRAGLLAYKFEQTNKAIEYLEEARRKSSDNAESLIALAKSYRKIDNLTLEIRSLKAYVNQYSGDSLYYDMQKRYFETLVESHNYERAYELWQDLQGDPYNDEVMMENYLLLNKATDNDKKATEAAENLLRINKKNKLALDWLARKYYYQAIERYNYEMQAYEKNRTHRQYAQLREAWPVIHDDLRTAKNYFKELYSMYPSSEYARFLSNIFERFNNDSKARYYRQRMND